MERQRAEIIVVVGLYLVVRVFVPPRVGDVLHTHRQKASYFLKVATRVFV